MAKPPKGLSEADSERLIELVERIRSRILLSTFEIGYHPQYDDELNEIPQEDMVDTVWWAKAVGAGGIMFSGEAPDPIEAVAVLADKLPDPAANRATRRKKGRYPRGNR